MCTAAPNGRITTAATRSLEIAADGLTPNSRISIGVINAPPPAPVIPPASRRRRSPGRCRGRRASRGGFGRAARTGRGRGMLEDGVELPDLGRERDAGPPAGCRPALLRVSCERCRAPWRPTASWAPPGFVRLVRERRLSCVEVAAGANIAIAKLDGAIARPFATPPGDAAIDRARELDKLSPQAAATLPLIGVPVGMKDVFDTSWLPTEYGSPIYRGHRPAPTPRSSGCSRRPARWWSPRLTPMRAAPSASPATAPATSTTAFPFPPPAMTSRIFCWVSRRPPRVRFRRRHQLPSQLGNHEPSFRTTGERVQHWTVNYGVRYEYFLPLSEKYGHLSDLSFGPGFTSPGVVTGLTTPVHCPPSLYSQRRA